MTGARHRQPPCEMTSAFPVSTCSILCLDFPSTAWSFSFSISLPLHLWWLCDSLFLGVHSWTRVNLFNVITINVSSALPSVYSVCVYLVVTISAMFFQIVSVLGESESVLLFLDNWREKKNMRYALIIIELSNFLS